MKSINIIFVLLMMLLVSCFNGDQPKTVKSENTVATAKVEEVNASVSDLPPPFQNIQQFNEQVTIGKTTKGYLVSTAETLPLFETSELSTIIARLKPIPAAIDHGNDWAANREEVEVLETKGYSLKIAIQEKKGWVHRSMIRFFVPMIVDQNGHFIADVFTNSLRYKGSKAQCWFVEEGGQPALMMEFRNWKEQKKERLKAMLDPATFNFTSISSVDDEAEEFGEPIQGLFSEKAWKTVIRETGANKPNAQQSANGKLMFGTIFSTPLTENTPAVKIGDLIYINNGRKLKKR